MSLGKFQFLGENIDFRILVDQIFANNEISSCAIQVPFRMQFSLFGRNGTYSFTKATINFVKAELRTKDSHIKCAEKILFLNQTVSVNQHVIESQFWFSLSHETINAIEQRRKDDLNFTLAIFAQAAVYNNPAIVADFSQGSGHVDFTIPQSQWIKDILPATGYQALRLIEIPSISRLIPEAYGTSMVELDEARKYYTKGDYDKSVGHCRAALDPFKPYKDEFKTYIKSKHEVKWINNILEATDEWLLKLVRETASFTSKAHHIPSVGHFGRSEAEIIIMITTGLIAYIGRLEER